MKKIFSLLLVLTMLLSSTSLMFSCSKDKNEEKENSKTEVKTYDEESIFYERSLIDDGLGTRDFGGRILRVVADTPSEIHIDEDKRNQGDLILDAKFTRNEAVENRFNVNIEMVYTGSLTEVSDYVSKNVLAGADEFDLLMGQVMATGGLVIKKLFLNWYDIEHIDFSKPWWYASNSDELTYDGKAPIAISHLNQSAVGGAYCLYFNKNLAASYELGNLYSTVLDGKWTFDKLHEMVKDVYVDDGNDKRDEADFYGFAQMQGTHLNSYLWAFDNPIVTKDEVGIPQVSVKTDKINSIVNSVYDFCFNTNGVYFDPYKANDATPNNLFFNKQSIFIMSYLSHATGEKMRNFEDDYGILPLPKFDETQSEYKTILLSRSSQNG